MKLSVVIPAHNEAGSIAATVEALVDGAARPRRSTTRSSCVDDASTDGTGDGRRAARPSDRPTSAACARTTPRGFGFAVRAGLEHFTGDAVAIMMADASDSPRDLVRYYRLLEAGYDCAFGSRFMPGGARRRLPALKLVINRVVNFGIRMLFGHGYNDTTNAFKAYRREVIETVAAAALQPLQPDGRDAAEGGRARALLRGRADPWRNRAAGESKLALQEMGCRYLFIVLYVFLEHHLSRGDYHRAGKRVRLRPTPWRRDAESGEALR